MPLLKTLLCQVLLLASFTSQAQLAAFPGAKGFGKFSVGGRGGEVIFVTNLNNDGVGSLRFACESQGPRTVIFKTGGTINLNSAIEITNPNITIAGQTAPGGGICLRMNDSNTTGHLQALIAILADDVIIRGIRFRAGPSFSDSNVQIYDCLDIWDGENIIVDHCSFTWGDDENIAIWSDLPNETPKKITVQNSIIGQALKRQEGANTSRGYGMLVGGSVGATEVSIVGNLFIHNTQRNPLLKSEQSSIFEVYNNVVYNYGFFGTDFSDDVQVNLLSNYYLPGTNTSTNRYEALISQQALLYADGNIGPNRPDNSQAHWDIVGFNGTIPPAGYCESPAPLSFQSATPFTTIPDDLESAENSYNHILNSSNVGASFKLSESGNGEIVSNLDEVDLALIQNLINNNGSSIFDTDIGSTIQYPILDAGTATLDSDSDGMPDVWESNCGLNLNDPNDRNGIASNNYTNLENYLNNVSCSISSPALIVNQDDIQILPNPFSDKIIVDGNFNNYEIKILDISGQTVLDLSGVSTPIEIDLTQLGIGIYFIYIQNQSNNQLMVQKIIKDLE